MLVYRGEMRLLAVDLAAVLAEGDSLGDYPAVQIVHGSGRDPVDLSDSVPADPSVSGTEVEFWVDIPLEQEVGNYLVIVTCATTNGEVIVEEAPLVIQ